MCTGTGYGYCVLSLTPCCTKDLLEKNRVVRQNPMERNFHIFYAMLAGATPAEREQLRMRDPNSFHYLNQSGCISDPTINDVEDFARVSGCKHIVV